MTKRSLIAHCRTLGLGLLAACLPLSAADQPTFAPIHADYLAEGAGASHTMGWFFFDIDSNGDGIPNFAQVNAGDDLDGDGIVNGLDDDDDNDGIPDQEDRAGYFAASGPAAGEAPASMPAHFFAYGAAAAAAGLHPNDYWQFVPNGFFEQEGAPYQDRNGTPYARTYQHPGANLYIDRNGNLIPDALEKQQLDNTEHPGFVLDRDFNAYDAVGEQAAPGLLGSWSGQLTGETLFYQCDDDRDTGHISHFDRFNPYALGAVGTIRDTFGTTDANPDYLLYQTDNPLSPAIPSALKEEDARGVALWRYRRMGATISSAREIVLFATVYYPMRNGGSVNVLYSKAAFNADVRTSSGLTPNGATSGDGWGGCDIDNWFPRYQNQSDHDRIATCQFGEHTMWNDIATFPVNGLDRPRAHDLANQAWVDQWANLTLGDMVINTISLAEWMDRTTVNAAAVIAGRYGVDLASLPQQIRIRYVEGRATHFVVQPLSVSTADGVFEGTLIGIEDLDLPSDNDFDDVVLMLNRPLEGR